MIQKNRKTIHDINQGGLSMQGNWAFRAVCGEVLGLGRDQ